MPPATRREVRLSASLPDNVTRNGSSQAPDTSRSAALLIPNIEAILENFELFKRKHISQNREIIKANTLHQIRARELENRIQLLEVEKAQRRLQTVALEATISHLRHAIASIYAGWESIGRGLALTTTDPAAIPSFHFDEQPASWPPSNRIKLEPNPNTAAVVKTIAQAPGGHVGRLEEEPPQRPQQDSPSKPLGGSSVPSRLASGSPEPSLDEWQHHFAALQAAQFHGNAASKGTPHDPAVNASSTIDIEGAPSPMGSPELPSELEDAIAAATSRSMSHSWSNRGGAGTPVPKPLSLNMHFSAPEDAESVAAASRQPLRRSGRRQSGFLLQSDQDQHFDAPVTSSEHHSPPPPGSEPHDVISLPSEVNSEMMEGILVYEGDRAHSSRSAAFNHPPTPFLDITNRSSGSPYLVETFDQHGDEDINLGHVPSAKAAAAAARQSSGETPYDWSEADLATGRITSEARTPGGRKRKVPAHELPELLPTPMRLFGTSTTSGTPIAALPSEHSLEPDTGRTRRVRKSINYALPKLNTKMRKPDPSDLIPATTPHRSNRSTPSSARGMIGSTGNLSDIRKLHEEAALRQSPAERTSNLRSHGSPGRAAASRAKGTGKESPKGQDEIGGRMADLFEIRQQAKLLANHTEPSHEMAARPRAFWDGITDTSDDESRVTSNADLGELAELEVAMGELSTVDEGRQADTPRAPQPSAWPSHSSVGMSASSSTDSMASCSSGANGCTNAAMRPSLRRKTTTLPSRSRQSSVEQNMQAGTVMNSRSVPEGAADNATVSQASVHGKPELSAEPSSPKMMVAPVTEEIDAGVTNASRTNDVKKASQRVKVGPSAAASGELGKGRPPAAAGGLVAGMKPKQRPASAGALLSSRTPGAIAHAETGTERARTFSGTTAASAGLTQPGVSAGSSGGTKSSVGLTSHQRASLHSALTSQNKVATGQVTPRIGAKGLPAATTPTFRESPRTTSTPVLRPAPSLSSLASESSGRSSPALSSTSSASTGTQLSSSTRTSTKPSTGSSQLARAQRPGTTGSTTANSASARESTTAKLGGQSALSASARPQPARSMPSLRRGSEKAAVTSTPRITVRSSSSSTLPSAAGAVNGVQPTSSGATIAASKVAKVMSSSTVFKTKEAVATPLGLGIDFSSIVNDLPAGKELLSLTSDIEQVVNQTSSPLRAASSSSAAQSSSSASARKGWNEDAAALGPSQAKARRASRRISGMAA